MDYLKLKDKVLMITGAGRGIGEKSALSFAAHGAHVVVCDINDENGAKVAAQINRDGGHAVFLRCDVTKPAEIKAVVDRIIAEFGRIDILFSNAGAGSNRYCVEDITDEEWYRILELDLKSTFNVCREVVPYMKKARYGKIIVSSSGGGVAGMAYNAHYAAAKAGLIGFVKSLCWELAEFGITANAIAIPSVVTPGSFDVDYDDDMDAEIPEIPMRRLGTTEDVANMALFLASDVSEYVSGQVMQPNGGKR